MIRVQDLQKCFGEVRAVDGISFAIDRGEVVGFLGPNGAGKSTTMRLLTGYLQPDAGQIEIAGQRVTAESLEVRRAIGYLPESTPLYRRMRVRDYLDFVGRVRGLSRVDRKAAFARVVSDCDLAGTAGRRIGELSKGYRQRVGLAQALLADPDVLILDEPTSGLDPAEIARIRELIRTLGERKTILLSTHILSEVQETCRRVIILADGRIVADGSPIDLAENERAELRVTLRGAADGALEALGGVAGVVAARATGADGERIGFTLEVDDRYAAAERVASLTHERGWILVELRHELPSLEQVFLRTTERPEP
ncbi:MAG: ATP-binding cassette domain-containing protein [Planctomycetota bacterium]|nr:ATP-binding cassette domain-containing protein [Planctomycetota bacterium]